MARTAASTGFTWVVNPVDVIAMLVEPSAINHLCRRASRDGPDQKQVWARQACLPLTFKGFYREGSIPR